MSRTYRRKDYESTQGTSWDLSGSKIGGFHAQWDVEAGYGYRPATQSEINDYFWLIHGESRNRNQWSPGREYRKYRERRLRMHNKQELQRFIKNEEYEPLIDADPLSHLWDWR